MKNLFVKCDSFLAHSSNCDPHRYDGKPQESGTKIHLSNRHP